jgi:hypothetical protein
VVDLTDDSPDPTPVPNPPAEEGRKCTLGCGQWIPRDEWHDHQLAHAQVPTLQPPHVLAETERGRDGCYSGVTATDRFRRVWGRAAGGGDCYAARTQPTARDALHRRRPRHGCEPVSTVPTTTVSYVWVVLLTLTPMRSVAMAGNALLRELNASRQSNRGEQVAAAASTSTSTSAQPPTLIIATWNLYGPAEQGDASSLRAIVKALRESNADVIMIQCSTQHQYLATQLNS